MKLQALQALQAGDRPPCQGQDRLTSVPELFILARCHDARRRQEVARRYHCSSRTLPHHVSSWRC